MSSSPSPCALVTRRVRQASLRVDRALDPRWRPSCCRMPIDRGAGRVGPSPLGERCPVHWPPEVDWALAKVTVTAEGQVLPRCPRRNDRWPGVPYGGVVDAVRHVRCHPASGPPACEGLLECRTADPRTIRVVRSDGYLRDGVIWVGATSQPSVQPRFRNSVGEYEAVAGIGTPRGTPGSALHGAAVKNEHLTVTLWP
jgi:hypothetical protein